MKIKFIVIVSIITLVFTFSACKSVNGLEENSSLVEDHGYVPIIQIDDNKNITFDESNNITSSEKGIDYVGSEKVGFVCLANSWREVTIPDFNTLPIAKEATEYRAYEDSENKYLLILANYGKATGNQDELSKMIEQEPALGSSSVYYPSGTLVELANTKYGYIQRNSVFKGTIPVGYEFFATIPRDDVETPKYGLDDNNNILRGTIFEYNETRYGIMYMRYNAARDINFEALCNKWIPRMATEEEIINQIMNKNKD